MKIIVNKFEEKDIAPAVELLKYCYDIPKPQLDKYRMGINSTRDQWYAIRSAEENLVGGLRILPFKQNIRGIFKPMAGIADVFNAPEFRRNGLVREAMVKAFEEM